MKIPRIFILVLLLLFSVKSAFSQDVEMLKIFVDCDRCDIDYLRQKVAFVNYVYERKNADLHLLVTSRATNGGQEYRLNFRGQNHLKDKDQILTFIQRDTETEDELRQKLTRTFTFGLLRYISDTPLAGQLKVTYEGKNNIIAKDADPWDFWLFDLTVNGYMSGQKRSNFKMFDGTFAAVRITEEWKISAAVNKTYTDDVYKLEDGSRVSSINDGYFIGSQFINSLGEHWGIGAGAILQQNSFYNLSPSYRFIFALERNLFSYKESSERTCTVTLFSGLTKYNYNEMTVYNKLNETKSTQGARMSLDMKRTWGNIGTSTQFTQLGQFSNNRLTFSLDSTLRIVKGLSLNIYGSAERIRDQIYLAKRNMSSEDILLQRQALESGFNYSAGLSITFTFGSKYNNVVNSRFGPRRISLAKIF